MIITCMLYIMISETNVFKMFNVTANENSSGVCCLTTDPGDVTTSEPSSFITEEAYKSFAFYTHLIVTPVLCIFGIVFNALGFGVIWPDVKQQKMSIYTYLCTLTLSDMIYLLIGLIRTIPTILKSLDIENAAYFEEHMKRWSIYFDMVFSHTSLALILVMSFERMLALVRPLKVKRTWFAKYPFGIIALCFFANVLFLLPFIVYFEVASFSVGNTTAYFIRFNPSVEEEMERYHVAQTIVDYFIPAVCLLVTNITIPIKYYRITQSRKTKFSDTAQNFTSRQMKVTLTVFAVTLMYFLLSVPNLTIKILSFVDTDYSFDGKHKLVFWFAIDLSNLFAYINAANDCIIYVLVSDYYRGVFKRKYCTCNCSSSEDNNGEVSSDYLSKIDTSPSSLSDLRF